MIKYGVNMIFISSKKGQFYIMAAVILCGLAVSLTTSAVVTQRSEVIFQDIRTNFMRESSMSINSAKGSGLELYDTFEDFLYEFGMFANSRNVDFSVAYFLKDSDVIYIKNNLDSILVIEFPDGSTSLDSGVGINLSSYEYINVIQDGESTLFSFGEGSVELRALFEMSFK